MLSKESTITSLCCSVTRERLKIYSVFRWRRAYWRNICFGGSRDFARGVGDMSLSGMLAATIIMAWIRDGYLHIPNTRRLTYRNISPLQTVGTGHSHISQVT